MDENYQDFTERMTTISRSMYDDATGSGFDITDAVTYLKDNARLRTLRSVLESYARETDEKKLKKLLAAGLMANHPDANEETVKHRIRDWMRKPQHTVDKETAIELCFVLKLTMEEADTFVAMLTEEGFHWRSPKELAYIFALANGMTYPEASALAADVQEIISKDPEALGSDDSARTDIIHGEVSALTTREELLAYIHDSRARLGVLHQTSYHMFTQMLRVLSAPDHDEAKESGAYGKESLDARMSVKDILTTFLHRGEVPQPGKKTNKYTAVQRSILRSWPTETDLSMMKTRAMDVNRKTLMLLFLATDGEPLQEEDEYDTDLWLDEEDEEDEEAIFESACIRLNTMLAQCGLRLLDPRVPFDWMVLYCLHDSDLLDMDANVQEFLQQIYQDDDGDE